MKALVFNGEQGVQHQTVDDPMLRDDDGAIVRVTHCSICGSDSQFYHGFNNASDDVGFCIGHEAVGEIAEVGRNVNHLSPGDPVMLAGLILDTCGDCATCKAGQPRYCRRQNLTIYGNSLRLHGSQAEAVLVPNADANATLIPDGISHEQALLLTDTLPTAFIGCQHAAIKPGSDIAVIGLGPIGLMAVELAYALGAGRVFAIDPIAYRREKAEGLGATAIAPDTAFEAIVEATDGLMVGSIVDAAGNDASIELSAMIAAYHGTISCVGISHSPHVKYPQIMSIAKSLTFRSALSYVSETWPDLVPMLQQGRIQPEKVLSHTLPLAEGERAYELFMNKLDDTTKIVLNP
ncbi:MAG: alcohol dehydrogenase catalytic domain-containing protein [Gammaproteobacteria bacterium]|nr:alcohol dehydrogenase catalytic domain-containing protein [Gammaproteobacteria bacterium]